MTPERRLAELGIELLAGAPGSAHVSAVRRSGAIVYLSGQIATVGGKLIHRGRVGSEITLEQAQECSRACAVNLVAQMKVAAGELTDVAAIVKLTVFVASAEGFDEQHLVANGASELLTTVFGEVGRHARSAIGVAGLPKGSPVEAEAVIELRQSARIKLTR